MLTQKLRVNRSAGGRFIVLLALFLCFAVFGPAPAQELLPVERDLPGQVDPAAEKAAEDYLYALARGDKERLLELTPKDLEKFYGPPLFREMPVLKNPRAKGHRGLIDFEGESTDPALPSQGTISMTMRDSRQFDRWQVRAIVWKSGSNLTLNPFKYSPTEKDRIQEVQIRACAAKYLKAWMEEDWQGMDHMTFDWINRRSLKGSFYVRSLDFDSSLRPDGSVRVEFRAKVSPRLPILGLIRRTAEGFFYVVQEDGQWKVRRMTASL